MSVHAEVASNSKHGIIIAKCLSKDICDLIDVIGMKSYKEVIEMLVCLSYIFPLGIRYS